jgi:D-alanyl-D-alanine carboxypeptidase (penicillin-binding protein 5/6)
VKITFLVLIAIFLVGMPAHVALATDLPLSTICIEARTGLVLTQSNAGLVRPPASMIKMMLFYLVSEGLENGSWHADTPIEISAYAESIGGTQLYLETGEIWTLGDLMQGIAVASANDAAMAVAEGLWGSKAAYLEAANKKAQELGLVQTVVRSVHGLPPEPGELPDETTARDMAVLAQWCVLSPQIMQWAGCREWTPPGETSPRQNTNKLLYQLDGCDGLKTGYITAAGFCLTATVLRDEVRLIAVVMGCSSNSARFAETQAVLDTAFANVERVQAVSQGEELVPVAVDNCETPNMPLRAAEDVWVVVPRADRDRIELRVEAPERVVPPIVAGHEFGQALIYLDERPLGQTALVASLDLQPAGWTWKLRQSVSGWLQPSVTAGR